MDSGLVDAPSGDLPADPGPADSADVGEADASDGLEVAPEVDGTPEVDAGPDGGGPLVCVPEALGEVKRLELPEASGAVWIDNALGRGWLVIADSGNKGAGALLDPVAYLTLPVEFPLDAAAGDDVEGLALSPLGRVVGLVSSGYIREWTADATGLVLAQFATAVTDDADYLCDPQGGNCAANFEGFCLHPAPGPDAACVGFAVSKARGELVCVVSTDDGYRLDPSQRLAVGEAEQLSGCDYELEAPHRLVVAGNLFALSALWEVRGYDDLATAEVLSMPLTGAANQEALGFGPGGLLISFGDTQGLNGSETSPMVGFRCK
ncbi:MAG: hypothetical protein R3F39_16155 [Myxococcota bacterium]